MKTLKQIVRIVRFDIDFNNEESDIDFRKDNSVMLRYALYKYYKDKTFTLYFLNTLIG